MQMILFKVHKTLKRKSSGSAMIESAIVFPMVLLLVFSMLSLGIKCMNKVKEKSLEYENNSETILNPSISQEELCRLKRIQESIIDD